MGVSVRGVTHSNYTRPAYTQLLIDYGADVNKRDKKGLTALDYALQNASSYENMKILLDNGAVATEKAIEIIEQALKREDLTEEHGASDYDIVAEIVKTAKDQGMKMEIPSVIGDVILGRDKSATKAIKEDGVKKEEEINHLFFTAAFGGPETMEALIEVGASLDVMNARRQNPACVASCYGNLEMVKYLDQRGVDIKTVSNEAGPVHRYGGSAIDWAIYNGHLDVVEYLFEHGAKFTYLLEDDPHYNSLTYAARSGFDMLKFVYENSKEISNESICYAMLESIDANDKESVAYLAEKYVFSNQDNFNSLMMKCSRPQLSSGTDDLAMVKILVENGADVNGESDEINPEINGYGNFLTYAAESNQLDIMEYLIAQGANVNAVDGTGDSPVSKAILSGNLDALKCLVEHGADLNDKDVVAGIRETEPDMQYEGYDDMLDLAKQLGSEHIYEYVKDHM
jgi:ankyrin repeat protein